MQVKQSADVEMQKLVRILDMNNQGDMLLAS